jgi:hypothetical protein
MTSCRWLLNPYGRGDNEGSSFPIYTTQAVGPESKSDPVRRGNRISVQAGHNAQSA